MNSLLERSFELTQREYSNYIVQHILEKGKANQKEYLLEEIIKKHFIELCKNQFARLITILIIVM